LAEHGGADGVRDEGLLQSALGRPKMLLAYSDAVPDWSRLAAAFAFGIARNHPFIDGNKRTAYVVCLTFLVLNGWTIEATREDKYKAFLKLGAGEMKEEELAGWIRNRLKQAAPLHGGSGRRTRNRRGG
jgi:death on curing protein